MSIRAQPRDGLAPAPAPVPHGGRLDEARRLFPNAPAPWIDLSTGVSPRAFPLPPIAAEAWTRLPDADALSALEAVAARAYAAPPHVMVVAGAGTQAFIQWLPRVVPARRVATLGFTYAEHAASWRASGACVDCVSDLDQLENFDVAIVVNPNNPDGRVVAPDRLASLGRRMGLRGRLLVVDEAFMDFTPEHSLVPLMPAGGVLALRSFGKAYGLPGLRLGFALCSGALAEPLRAAMGPWSVAGPALAVGAAALADAAWLGESAQEMRAAVRRLDALLQTAGFAVLGGTALFRLASHERAPDWFEHFCARGILTRRFAERPAWLRLGAPGSSAAWDRLSRALEDRP
jgi:cobalamin biosynthetic protein CobC